MALLAKEFQDGKQYRSLNCYRSVISSAHLPIIIDGFPVGKHPLVCRLLKGVFNLQPPLPHYDCTWDITNITSFLLALGDNAPINGIPHSPTPGLDGEIVGI